MCNKVKVIKEAAKRFPKREIDVKGKGRGVKRIEDGEGVSLAKLDEMYQNAKTLLDREKGAEKFTEQAKKVMGVAKQLAKATPAPTIWDICEKCNLPYGVCACKAKHPTYINSSNEVILVRKKDPIHGEKGPWILLFSPYTGKFTLPDEIKQGYAPCIDTAQASLELYVSKHPEFKINTPGTKPVTLPENRQETAQIETQPKEAPKVPKAKKGPKTPPRKPKKTSKKKETAQALANLIDALEVFETHLEDTPLDIWDNICDGTDWDGVPTWQEISQYKEALQNHLDNLFVDVTPEEPKKVKHLRKRLKESQEKLYKTEEKLAGKESLVRVLEADNKALKEVGKIKKQPTVRERVKTKRAKAKNAKNIDKPSSNYGPGDMVLGFRLTLKKVGAKGKTYTKLYATRNICGKQQWVYIGDGNPIEKINAKLPSLDEKARENGKK